MYVNTDYNLANIFLLIDVAKAVMNHDKVSWEEKYDYIFDMKIWNQIRETGYCFSWYDPDCDY